jgi:hypothetical protein
MKATELVNKLQELVQIYGDCEIWLVEEGNEYKSSSIAAVTQGPTTPPNYGIVPVGETYFVIE